MITTIASFGCYKNDLMPTKIKYWLSPEDKTKHINTGI